MEVLKESLNSIPILGPFIILMARLFAGYFTNGLFFFGLHMVVVWLFYQTWYSKIRVEADALERWKPRGPAPPPKPRNRGWFGGRLTWLPRRQGEAETTRILDQFVSDCDNLGGQGVFIPLTDFSDRLDSIVDGITAEMHDRTNLFILVGVAGTLLGIFEFAFESQNALKAEAGQMLPKLLDALTSSMSKAFPVGFVGLLLTFFSQVLASFPERRLRTALAEATGKALAAREETSRSQASALQDSVQTMQETMGRAIESMEGAMRPLANLQQTLGEFLEPTMNELSKHLDNSLKLVGAQHEEMKKTNEGTQEIVNSAKQAVAELRLMVDTQVEQSRQTQAANASTAEAMRAANESMLTAMRQQQEALALFNATLDGTLGRVEVVNQTVAQAAENFEALPNRLHGAAQLAFDRLAVDTLSVWRAASDELKHEIAGEHERLLDGAAAQAREVHATLMSASSELAGVAAGVGASVEGLKMLPEHLEAEMRRVFGSLAGDSTEHWRTSTDAYMNQMRGSFVNFLGLIHGETERIQQALQGASNSLSTISQQMDNTLRVSLRDTISVAREEISLSLQHVNRVLVEQYPQLSQNVLTLSEGMKEAVVRSSEIQKESAVWLSGIRGAHQRLEEVNRVLADALARARQEVSPTNAEQVRSLLQQNVDELKGLGQQLVHVGRLIPASGQLQGVSEQLRDGLDRTARLLRQIHEDLAPKAPDIFMPPPKPPFWRRLWPFGRRANNGTGLGAAASGDGAPESEIRR